MTTVPCRSFPATMELSAKEIETSFWALKQIEQELMTADLNQFEGQTFFYTQFLAINPNAGCILI
jgi:hypothetical protein